MKATARAKKSSAKSEEKASTPAQRQQASLEEQTNDALSPAIRRLLAEHTLDAAAIKGTGVGGRLTREDIEKHLAKAPSDAKAEAKAPAAAPAAQPALGARSEKTRADDSPA
ncbi:Dihydrolipoyllysine-residue succinyltransferase component of 2-oxoglutarate dehydrogenase complex [Leclercia adecarboxylata]|uniref:Dihydrolipoyllysine-residue succinyltransferase component of 2-oxoglutarate dehydrogenase complex n=1 Tax=Leclercia adecarboxylata TaxID=83655 RepID=A0A4U9HM96_9ENTR|nr:Dihydrolipoyllysine-residue succinyltransferase component of 2-oxoglutarate dehydrogenase complex [Leclercia adecarboxylata]